MSTQASNAPTDAPMAAATGEQEFVISRTFKAPRELVFKAWTEPEHLKKWWGPKGSTITIKRMEFKPGGVLHYSMLFNGAEMWGLFKYRDIVRPEKIVFTNSFSDADANIAPNPWLPNWPLEILNTLTMDEQNGETTVTMRGGPIDATDEQRALFVGNFPSMQGGFKGTFDELEQYLASLIAAEA